MLRPAALVAFLILALPLRANLGDTVAGCITRYGKPEHFAEANGNTPFGTLLFLAGPYDMVIFLYNNVEVGARVDKRDKTGFSPAEIQTILGADASSPWILTKSDDPASQEWTRADKASATYDTSAKVLFFTTPAMAHALHSAPASAPSTNAAPPRPQGNFAPAAPTTWTVPTPASTNVAPATTTGPLPQQ